MDGAREKLLGKGGAAREIYEARGPIFRATYELLDGIIIRGVDGAAASGTPAPPTTAKFAEDRSSPDKFPSRWISKLEAFPVEIPIYG